MTGVDHVRVNIVQHIGTYGPSELAGRDVLFLRSSSFFFFCFTYMATIGKLPIMTWYRRIALRYTPGKLT